MPGLLAEDTVLDVCVNPDRLLWVNCLSCGFAKEREMSAADSALPLSCISTARDLVLNEKNSILETMFPLTGDRPQGLVVPIATAAAFAIRTRRNIFRGWK